MIVSIEISTLPTWLLMYASSIYDALCSLFAATEDEREREREQSKSMVSFNKGYLFYDSLYFTLPHPIFYSNSLLRQPGY